MSTKDDNLLLPCASPEKPSQRADDSRSCNAGISEMEMSARKWSLLWVTTASTSLVFLDNTIMPVALPTIEGELGFSPVGAMWIVNVYLLTLSALLLVGGRLVDLFGKRRLYFLGFTLFGLGSTLGGFSNSTAWLILSRMLQGMGGAVMLPTTASLLMAAFPAHERAKALGINTGISSLFLLLGPLLGGIFTNYVSWRVIFWVNLPVLLFGFLMGYRLLPQEKFRKGHFDFLGALALMCGITSLVVGLMQGSLWGWLSPFTFGFFAASLLLFFFYLKHSKREKEPLLDFKIFKQPLFKSMSFCIFMAQMALVVTVQWAVYFQEELRVSPFMTGVMILCATCPVLVIAPLGGILAGRLGPKVPMACGYLMMIFSLLWIYTFVERGSLVTLLPGLLSFGVGIPLIFSPAFATAMTHIPSRYLGVASSVITLTRQVGGTLGIAVMTAVYHSVYEMTTLAKKAFSATLFVSIAFATLGLLITLRRRKN